MAVDLSNLNSIDGFVGAALVDSSSGMAMGQEGGGPVDLDVAAAGNTEVIQAKRRVAGALKLKDTIEDLLITLGKQYHLIRPLADKQDLFLYLVLDRTKANLGMARHQLKEFEGEVAI